MDEPQGRGGGGFLDRIWHDPTGRLLTLGLALVAGFILIQRFGQSLPGAATPAAGLAPAPVDTTNGGGGTTTDGTAGVPPINITITNPPPTGMLGATTYTLPPRTRGNLPPPRFIGPPAQLNAPGGPISTGSINIPGGYWQPRAVIGHPILGAAPAAVDFHPLG